MQRHSHALRDHEMLPRHPRSELKLAPHSWEEPTAAVVGPDDLALDIDDLASHFLFEATQSTLPPPSDMTADRAARFGEATLGEIYFDGSESTAQRREFERVWNQILARELCSTEL